MIPFDPSKIKHEYVYLKKISKFSIEVNNNDIGEIYAPVDVKHTIRNGKTIIPIHNKVFMLYSKSNYLVEFADKGRRACISYYDGYVLTVDIYKPFASFSGARVEEKDWESLNIEALNKIIELIQEAKSQDTSAEVYIDGETIFFADRTIKPTAFRTTKNFWIQPIRYIQLSKMAVKVNKDFGAYMNKSENKETIDLSKVDPAVAKEVKKDEKSEQRRIKKEETDTLIVLKSGFVLAYNPSIEEDPDFVVYSSVMSDKEDDTKTRKPRFTPSYGMASPKTFLKMEDSENPLYFNLLFALRAGKVIGEHYGFDETDFLDIPSVILSTEILNLKNDISYQSRANYPMSLNTWDCLAYMFRFFHKEKDLNIYRNLVSLFTYSAKHGFVAKKNTGKIFREGKSVNDIPKRTIHLNHKEAAEKEGFMLKNDNQFKNLPARNKHSRRYRNVNTGFHENEEL